MKYHKSINTAAFCLLAIISLLQLTPSLALANCPYGCQCNDETLLVKCEESSLDVLPIALNPFIKRLIIKNNRIKTIESSIQFYTELTFLDLSKNLIHNIPTNTFAYQRKLQELNLNYNKIGQVNNKTFVGLSVLTVMNLRGNLIAELEQGTFAAMSKLEELNLGENRISRIDEHAFDGLENLKILYLDDNTLTLVPSPLTFKSMPRLAELFLGTNSFMSIPGGAFENLQQLTKLDLRGAGLHNLTADSLKGLSELRYLDLADNRLPHIPSQAFKQLERLEELMIGQNDFEVLGASAFAGLKQLKNLEITAAPRLQRVATDAFAANANLNFLNLSFNKMLTQIDENAFSGLPHLRTLILKANQVGSMEAGMFPWSDLQSLDLSENPIVCDCRILWLQHLLMTKNTSTDVKFPSVLCFLPERMRDMPLTQVTPAQLGCSHSDSKHQAMIGVLLVAIAATITALALLLYACRRRIREALKGGWGNSALGRKEREYQKTFSDEEYMTRQQQQQMPCNLAIHAGASAPYANGYNHSQYMGSRPIPVTEL